MNTRAAVLRRSADPGEVGPEAFSGISIEDVTVDEPRQGEARRRGCGFAVSLRPLCSHWRSSPSASDGSWARDERCG